MDHFDINKICEDVFCTIFKEIYGFENLRNLNEDEGKNFPGIDLADDVVASRFKSRPTPLSRSEPSRVTGSGMSKDRMPLCFALKRGKPGFSLAYARRKNAWKGAVEAAQDGASG